ncbi:MAG: 4Fe-4S dicluster domain-containing protein [Dehalococcoidia bacterium]|nr:4Fe-4S dicluster domain-containing protein [Dehalococcoidia bacterium]
MSESQATFKRRLAKALASPTLETALNRTLPNRRVARAKAFSQVDFAALRTDLQSRKRAAIDQMPELVQQFTEKAQAAGAVVHIAQTPQDARAIVSELAKRHGVKLVVKSKSMATEEIDLNEHLEAQHIEVVETDLGEWIVQLAGEKPSHLITPALHKTREEVAELFTRVTGEYVPPDIPTMVAIARKRLRQKFIDADMGITGANVAIAETGSLVLVSNEGNARLVSTLPPVHVAILGIEKVVPTMDDATAVLRVLSRSGTGQTVTTYISYITGPSRTADIELSLTVGVHGPKEVHIILLDNGRTLMRERPEFRDALDCIRCGACLNACPPFQAVGGHAFGYKYTGPIGLVLTAFHHGYENAEGPQTLCLGCNACETVCPAGIDIPRMILDLRQEMREGEAPGLLKGRLLDFLTYQQKPGAMVGLARFMQLPFQRPEGLLHIPGVTGWRSLPRIPGRSFYAKHRPGSVFPPTNRVPSAIAGRDLLYFPACITDNLLPDMGDAAVEALTGLGARVTLPARAQCCGLAHMNSGDRATATRLAKETIALLEQSTARHIVSTSASCTVAMTQDYPHLLRDEPEWAARAVKLAERITDFTRFIDGEAQLAPGSLSGDAGSSGAGPGAGDVTYHDACQSCNCLKVSAQPRRLLSQALGATINEMQESSACCGFGGTFSLDYPKISQRILGHKLDHIAETGAPVVVTDNPGCIMHLRGGLAAAGKKTRVLHLAELIAERLPRT